MFDIIGTSICFALLFSFLVPNKKTAQCYNVVIYGYDEKREAYSIIIYFGFRAGIKIKRFITLNKYQRCSRGHKARGQGHKKNPRPRIAFSRTDTLEAKDRNARGQGHKRKCSPKKKRSSQKFFKRSPQKNVFQKNFQALHKIFKIQKIVLSSSRGQANFRGLEASRPRTSKCVLEAKDVLEDSTSDKYINEKIKF